MQRGHLLPVPLVMTPMSQPLAYLLVCLGGSLGAASRYFLASAIHPTRFPLATFLINITGCFAIGLITTFLSGKAPTTDALRLFLVVGFLGAYTTFSTFGLENHKLLSGGSWEIAAAYISASVFLGVLAVKWGVLCGKVFT